MLCCLFLITRINTDCIYYINMYFHRKICKDIIIPQTGEVPGRRQGDISRSYSAFKCLNNYERVPFCFLWLTIRRSCCRLKRIRTLTHYTTFNRERQMNLMLRSSYYQLITESLCQEVLKLLQLLFYIWFHWSVLLSRRTYIHKGLLQLQAPLLTEAFQTLLPRRVRH